MASLSGGLFSGLVLLTACLATPCRGETLDQGVNQEQAIRLRQAGLILPLQEVLRRAGIDGARVIDIRLLQRRGRYLYFIAWLADEGEVREATLNAMNTDFD